MGYWPRHPRKDLQTVLGEYHAAGWTIERGKKYYRVQCPAPCKTHQRYIHLTPSDPRYARNAISWLYRQACYEGSAS